jgi:hypothetical protein
MRIFVCKYLKYLKGPLTSRKILRHGTSGFNSRPKEGVMWIFNSLKNPLILPDMKPRPLRPVASALTTTPPRRPLSTVIRNFLQVANHFRSGSGITMCNRLAVSTQYRQERTTQKIRVTGYMRAP